MVCIENDHLRGTTRLAAALDDARKRVVSLHERDRTARRTAARKQLTRRPDRRQIAAGPRTEFEEHPLGPREREDRVHGVFHRINKAGRALGSCLETAVEPHRTVERGFLIHEQVLHLLAERCERVLAGKVTLVACPARDGVDDAANQLLDAVLALGRIHLPAKIFRDDDVGGLLGPEGRDLDVALFEDDLPLLVADDGRASLPFDLVERIDAGQGEVAWKFKAWNGRTLRFRGFLSARFDGSALGRRRPSFHARPPYPARTYPCGCARKILIVICARAVPEDPGGGWMLGDFRPYQPL